MAAAMRRHKQTLLETPVRQRHLPPTPLVCSLQLQQETLLLRMRSRRPLPRSDEGGQQAAASDPSDS